MRKSVFVVYAVYSRSFRPNGLACSKPYKSQFRLCKNVYLIGVSIRPEMENICFYCGEQIFVRNLQDDFGKMFEGQRQFDKKNVKYYSYMNFCRFSFIIHMRNLQIQFYMLTFWPVCMTRSGDVLRSDAIKIT